MSRKKLIEALMASGKNSISGKGFEDCYTADLMVALREETDGKKPGNHKILWEGGEKKMELLALRPGLPIGGNQVNRQIN